MSELVPALEPIPFGSPVEEVEGGCRIMRDLGRMSGVARRPRGNAGIGYAAGEGVAIARDGGISAVLAADAEIEHRGVTVRLMASDRHYFTLQGGRIVGLLGDGARR